MQQISQRNQFLVYCLFSNIVAAGVIWPVIQTSPTFYAAGVRLSEGMSVIVLANWFVVMAAINGKLLQNLLFGELRLIEIEHIYERSRFTVLNSLIALTMFSNDFLLVPGILTLFSLFMKLFHWVLHDRFDYIFQHATTPQQIVGTRNTFTLLFLLYVDYNLVRSCVEYSFGNNPDVYVAFGFEFAVLFLNLVLQSAKVLLNTYELVWLREHPDEDIMESKSLYMKILDITHSMLVLLIHLFLLFTLVGPYRSPIYFFKDVFSNLLGLIKQIKELRRYQLASKELDTRLQDVTEEELSDDNNLCIICRDDMTTEGVRKGERSFPKKLHCGHIIHLGCLKGWFERSQACPMCRAPVFNDAPSNSGNANQQQQGQQQQQPHHHHHHQQQQQQQQGHSNAHINHPEPDRLPSQQTVNRIVPPPFLNRHRPQVAGGYSTSSNYLQASTTDSGNGNTLRITSNQLTPPDWVLFKISNGNATKDEYQLKLNESTTARIKKISQEDKVKLFKNLTKKEAKQSEDS